MLCTVLSLQSFCSSSTENQAQRKVLASSLSIFANQELLMAMSSQIVSSASKDQLITTILRTLLSTKISLRDLLLTTLCAFLHSRLSHTLLSPNLLFFLLILLIFLLTVLPRLTKYPLASSRSLLYSILFDSRRQPPQLAPLHQFGSISPHNSSR